MTGEGHLEPGEWDVGLCHSGGGGAYSVSEGVTGFILVVKDEE